MAVRFYLAAVVGAGTESDPFRPATTAVRPADWNADDGRPDSTAGAGRMLVRINVTDAEHAQLVALPGVQAVPLEDAAGTPLGLNDPISAIAPAKRAALRTALENNHIDTDDLQLTDPILLVLRRIKKRLKLRNAILRALDFIESLDATISSIPAARRQNIAARLQQAGFDTSVLLGSDTIRVALRKLFTQAVRAIATELG
jgi:hypothetical protein